MRQRAGLEPPRGYSFRDAFRLWCNLKKGRIVSYQAEKRRLEKYVLGPIGSRQIDEITAPLVIQTVRAIEDDGHQATLKRILMRTREIMDLAVCAGFIHHNPIDRVSKVSRSYQRSDYLDARRDLMAKWSEYVETCARGAGIGVP